VSGDESSVVPGVDGSGGYTEQYGGFGQGENADVAESLFAAVGKLYSSRMLRTVSR